MKNELEFLYRVLNTIEGYLQDLILIGGFATVLYRFHEEAEEIRIPPLLTFDVDLATEGAVPIRGDKSIHESLEAAGLQGELMGNAEQPIVRYYPGEETDDLYYVEFLAPLSGSGVKRSGKLDLTQPIQKDLSAQKLRYLDLLMQQPWQVNTSSLPLLREHPGIIVKVPHPSMYIMQKILTLTKRKPTDRNKDYAYIYQTIVCFRKYLKSLANQYEFLISKPEWKSWYSKFLGLSREFFLSPDSDGPIEASEILDGVSPDMVSAAIISFVEICPDIK